MSLAEWEAALALTQTEWIAVLAGLRVEPTLPPVPPMPHAGYQAAFVGSSGLEALAEAGEFSLQVGDVLRAQGVQSVGRLLDFGCGWGRIYRLFLRDTPNLVGVDIDENCIKICRAAIPYGSFEVCEAMPPLQFPNESFDTIVAYSVFSHLAEHAFLAWIGGICALAPARRPPLLHDVEGGASRRLGWTHPERKSVLQVCSRRAAFREARLGASSASVAMACYLCRPGAVTCVRHRSTARRSSPAVTWNGRSRTSDSTSSRSRTTGAFRRRLWRHPGRVHSSSAGPLATGACPANDRVRARLRLRVRVRVRKASSSTCERRRRGPGDEKPYGHPPRLYIHGRRVMTGVGPMHGRSFNAT